MSNSITIPDTVLAHDELAALTGYEQATKQLNVLKERGFYRAYINRTGNLVLERAHYLAVCQGESTQKPKAANMAFLKKVA